MQHNEDVIRSISAREAVRLRPTLFLEKIFDSGNLDSFPMEVACHAIDEHYDNNCSKITITLYDDHFSLEYDAGMSLEKRFDETRAVAIMTKIFTCRNEKKHLAVGEEFCELGIATINFCCEYCVLQTSSNGKSGEFRFEKGVLTEELVTESKSIEEKTSFIFKPDPEIFGDLSWSYSGVHEKVEKVRRKLDKLTIELIDTNQID